MLFMTPNKSSASASSSFEHDLLRGSPDGLWCRFNLLNGVVAQSPAAAAAPEVVATPEASSGSGDNPDGVVSLRVSSGLPAAGLCWSELRVGHAIGRGTHSNSEVRKAQNRVSNALYAMKIFPLDTQTPAEPILRELRRLQALPSHTHVIRTYHVFSEYGGFQLLTELADVGSLQGVIDKVGPLSLEVLSCIFRQVVKGLGFLHEICHLQHRDLKPSNILLNSKGHVKLGDYEMPVVVTAANRGVGSFEYMSPERLSDRGCSPKSDIWSLGVTVAQAALGVFPLIAEWPQYDLINPFTQPTNAFLLAAMIADGRAYVDFDRIMPKIRQFRSSRPVLALLNLPRLSLTEYDSNSIAFDVRTFVSRCMAQSAPSRPSAAEMMAHPLITEHYKKVELRAWLDSHSLMPARKAGWSVNRKKETPLSPESVA